MKGASGEVTWADEMNALRAAAEAAPEPPPPPGLDAVVAELDRRQATRREAEQPAAAEFRKGVDLYWGHGVTRDVPGALALLESVAGSGNADAARFLALAYDGYGDRVPKSPETAMRWYEEAAELGFPQACGYLGRLFARGAIWWNGLPEEDALALLRLGAVRGDHDAARTLAWLLEERGGEDRLREAAWWHHAASRRDPRAALDLGLACGRGLGVERSDDMAAAWYRRGAELGDAFSMNCFAGRLFDGHGVRPDPVASVEWLRKATEEGPDGRHLLAMTLFRGEGVAPDPAEARRQFVLSAADEHLPSIFTTIEEEATDVA